VAELLRDAEGRLKFVQDQLQIEVSAEEIETRIAELKASVLRSEALDLGEGLGGNNRRSKKSQAQAIRQSKQPITIPVMLGGPAAVTRI